MDNNETRALQQRNLALEQELLVRAQPRLGEMMDALRLVTRNASAGNSAAKQMLSEYFNLLDEARAAASNLSIVRHNGHQP